MLTIYFDVDGCIIDHDDAFYITSDKEIPALTEREVSRIKDVYDFYNKYYKPQQLVYSQKYFESFQFLESITLERAALSADSIWLEEFIAGYVYNITFTQPITVKDLKAVTEDLKVGTEMIY